MTEHFHVIPVGDLRVHAAQSICWCFPLQVDPVIWVHNAKDCREVLERQLGRRCSEGWIIILEYK